MDITLAYFFNAFGYIPCKNGSVMLGKVGAMLPCTTLIVGSDNFWNGFPMTAKLYFEVILTLVFISKAGTGVFLHCLLVNIYKEKPEPIKICVTVNIGQSFFTNYCFGRLICL